MLMNVTNTEADLGGDETPAQSLLRAAQAVRDSGVLGRSRVLVRLFDYLVAASAVGRAPKEMEIALEVFGKAGDFEPGQDASVRVQAHRLRQKLEDFARRADPSDGHRLALPKGEYRLTLVAPPTAVPAAVAAAKGPRIGRWPVWLAALLVLANLGAWAFFIRDAGAAREFAQVRKSNVWAPFAHSPFPLLLVVGDYYIFGESDDGMEVSRLVREYSVNSSKDLDNYLMTYPAKQARYVDLNLSYLPTSSALGVSRISSLFAGQKPVRVITTSDLTPPMLKTYDIIYVGYLSGLGWLRTAVFSGSRYAIGETYDDLNDLTTNHLYSSQAGIGPAGGGVYRDYGYVSVMSGPAGNHIAVVAGSRDIGAMAAAEQIASAHGVGVLSKAAAGGGPFEALYEVKGQGSVNFQARVVDISRRQSPQVWSSNPTSPVGATP